MNCQKACTLAGLGLMQCCYDNSFIWILDWGPKIFQEVFLSLPFLIKVIKALPLHWMTHSFVNFSEITSQLHGLMRSQEIQCVNFISLLCVSSKLSDCGCYLLPDQNQPSHLHSLQKQLVSLHVSPLISFPLFLLLHLHSSLSICDSV